MAGGVACRACGVVLPGWVARCPACGSRQGFGRVAAYVAIALLVPLVLWGAFQLRRPRVAPGLAEEVQAFAGIRRFSADLKRIDVSGHVENKSQVAVDVIVRFRGKDVDGRVVGEVESERYRNLPPGSSTTVGASFSIIPLQEFEVDIVELAPTPQ